VSYITFCILTVLTIFIITSNKENERKIDKLKEEIENIVDINGLKSNKITIGIGRRK